MRKIRDYQVDYSRYTFKAEDDWGDYDNGKYREGTVNYGGYRTHAYLCDDGKWHTLTEHIAKWEFYNGKIPEGMEIDHIIPISNGGTNIISNLRMVTPIENVNNPLSIENMIKSRRTEEYKIKASQSHKGKKLSEETRKKLSEAHKGKLVGDKNPMFGKKHTTETLKKMSDALKGKQINRTDQSKLVYQYTLDNELIKIWPSTKECKRNGYNQGAISQCCNNRFSKNKNIYKGFKWSFEPLN